jgi:hypothetical protein
MTSRKQFLVVVIVLTVLYQGTKQGIPTHPQWPTDATEVLPYAALIMGAIGVLILRFKHARAYRKLAMESPGGIIKSAKAG